MDLKKTTCAIQGFGNVGSYAHMCLEAAGVKVVAVLDSKGGALKKNGIWFNEVAAHKKKTGNVLSLRGSEPITNEELVELDVDILVPAALEAVITEQSAGKLRGKIVA